MCACWYIFSPSCARHGLQLPLEDLQGLHCGARVNFLQVSSRELLFRLQLSLGVFVPLDRISTGSYVPHEANRHFGLFHRVLVSGVGRQHMNFDVGERRTPPSRFDEVASCCEVEEATDVSLAQVRVTLKPDDGILALEGSPLFFSTQC